MTIQRANHSNFFDFPFLFPLKQTNVDPGGAVQILGQYLLAIFDKHLSGIEQPVLEEFKGETKTAFGFLKSPIISSALCGRSRKLMLPFSLGHTERIHDQFNSGLVA